MSAILLDLIWPVAPISPRTLGQDVYDRFQAEPETPAIAVVDAQGRALACRSYRPDGRYDRGARQGQRRHDLQIRVPAVRRPRATRRIRAMAGPAAQAPILALTANADLWDAASYLSQGVDGVVEKPIKAERLLTAINAVFADEIRRSAA